MTAKLYGGYSTYGEVIGILKLETVEPKIPGDIGNATSYSFPVKYKIRKLIIPGKYGTHPATFKAALNILGKDVGIPRLPVLPVEEKYLPKLREDLREIGLLV